jgi:hypothetical protein
MHRLPQKSWIAADPGERKTAKRSLFFAVFRCFRKKEQRRWRKSHGSSRALLTTKSVSTYHVGACLSIIKYVYDKGSDSCHWRIFRARPVSRETAAGGQLAVDDIEADALIDGEYGRKSSLTSGTFE